MKRLVKIIFSAVLSVAMVLSLALTAYGASSLTSDFTVTVEKGKIFDEKGDLYTGWYIKNRHKYYAESGRRVRGWKKSENSITILQLTMLWQKTKLWVLNLKDIIM